MAEYMIAGPIIMRTAPRSLVARDMRSPVRWRWKYARSSRCRCAKKSLRRSYSISREAPMMIRRVREAEHASDDGERQQGHSIEANLARIHGEHEIVDRVLQHPGPGESHGCGGENAHETEQKRTAVPEDVAQQPAGRSHSLTYFFLATMSKELPNGMGRRRASAASPLTSPLRMALTAAAGTVKSMSPLGSRSGRSIRWTVRAARINGTSDAKRYVIRTASRPASSTSRVPL